ncbi:MAG: hypothetical protein L0027_02085 [Candidatus Rokubacteria bacterium]|nr:hypothetical protein [Candidatus Rokubacteria bacterium]
MPTSSLRPRRWRRIVPLLVCAVLGGCATGASGPPGNVTGTWVGELEPVGGQLGAAVDVAGPVHVRLAQTGADVSGQMHGLGFGGPVNGRMFGNTLTASLDATTIGSAIDVVFQGTVEGNTMQARLDDSMFTLRRRGPADPVYMQNPRTKHVVTCAGSQKVIESCSAGLRKDGWIELPR